MKENGKHVYFRAKYIWNGKKPRLNAIRKNIEGVLIRAHNDWAKLVNPRQEAWNEEYQGPHDICDENGYIQGPDISEETRFMQGKYRGMAKLLKPWKYSIFIDHFDVGDELELLAVTHRGASVSVAFKPVSIEEILRDQ